MKYYAVTGRIPGEDEDTLVCLGQLPSTAAAVVHFKMHMAELFSLGPEDVESLRKEHDTFVFINSIVSSDSPIKDEA